MNRPIGGILGVFLAWWLCGHCVLCGYCEVKSV